MLKKVSNSSLLENSRQGLTLALSLINLVNCSSASPSFCSSRHRDNYSLTINTCSRCLAGYEGIQGDSNSACYSEGRATAVILPNKECIDSCSGPSHGHCEFIDLMMQLTVVSCPGNQSSCVARCRCMKGYAGEACSLTTEEYNTKQDILRLAATLLLRL